MTLRRTRTHAPSFLREARRHVPLTPERLNRMVEANPEILNPPPVGLARLIATNWSNELYSDEGKLRDQSVEDMPPASIEVDPAPWLRDLRQQVRFRIENTVATGQPRHQGDIPLAYAPPGVLARYVTLRHAQKDPEELASVPDDGPDWMRVPDGNVDHMAAALESFSWGEAPSPLPHHASPLLNAAVLVRVAKRLFPESTDAAPKPDMQLYPLQELRWRYRRDAIERGGILSAVLALNRVGAEGVRSDDVWLPISFQLLLQALEGLFRGIRPQGPDKDWERFLTDPVPAPRGRCTHDGTYVIRYDSKSDRPDPTIGWICVETTQVIARYNGKRITRAVILFIPARMAWLMVVGMLRAQETHGAMLLSESPPPQCIYDVDGEELDRLRYGNRARASRPEAGASETSHSDATDDAGAATPEQDEEEEADDDLGPSASAPPPEATSPNEASVDPTAS